MELKSDRDDLVKGLGQLLEALAWGYHQALLVVGIGRVARLDPTVFKKVGFGLAAVNGKGEVTISSEARTLQFSYL